VLRVKQVVCTFMLLSTNFHLSAATPMMICVVVTLTTANEATMTNFRILDYHP